MITITAREDRLLEKRSLPFLAVSLLLLARSPPPSFPTSLPPSLPLFCPCLCISGARGDDGCPSVCKKAGMSCFNWSWRYVDRPDRGNRWQRDMPKVIWRATVGIAGFEIQHFFFPPFPFPSCAFSFFLGSPPPSFHPPTFHSFTSPMSLSLPPLSASHSVLGSPALSVSYFFQCFYHPFPKSPAHAAAYLCLNTLAPNLLI